MKTLPPPLALLFVIITFIFTVMAKSDPDIPTGSWDQHSEGVAIALIWKEHDVIAHVKNTSTSLKQLMSMGSNTYVKLFYIDAQGAAIPFGDHPFYNDARDDDSKEQGALDIAPGAVVSRPVAITSAEATLLKTHPVVCTVLIYDPATKQKSTVTSSPKLLTETPSGK